jgi:hypothetical protein
MKQDARRRHQLILHEDAVPLLVIAVFLIGSAIAFYRLFARTGTDGSERFAGQPHSRASPENSSVTPDRYPRSWPTESRVRGGVRENAVALERFVTWWFAIGLIVGAAFMGVALHSMSRIRTCPDCGERMHRLPHAQTGRKQMTWCDRCKKGCATGWVQRGRQRLGETLLDTTEESRRNGW